MRASYIVEEGKIVDHKIHFTLKTAPEGSWKPAGRVITDSDAMTFIYTIDENDAFSYFVFEESQWGNIVKVIESQQDPIVFVGDEEIVLTNFYEEVEALIYNIEGNSNYGETFVTAVEKAFSTILEVA